ncbi:S-type pyocin domain-containing protein [Streptomyces swartbergensis]|uniref:S-type pyocin domain-containing protein n=1 Tax=Streptomyces swartbergensis TaxID=487165 RepID=UPI00142E7DB1|nr:S-type pyocin domain-containing protein [Streptomyces swartbergensis]
MRAEEDRNTNNVVDFRAPGKAVAPAVPRPTAPGARRATETEPATVLNAERGIINTGVVHGGQHVTTVEFTGPSDAGADDE